MESQDPALVINSLFEEYDKLTKQKEGAAPIVQTSVFHQKDSAKDRLLREASELEKQTNSSRASDYDFNAELLDGNPKKKHYLKSSPNNVPQNIDSSKSPATTQAQADSESDNESLG